VAPRATLRLAGATPIVKSGGGVMMSVAPTSCARLPAVPRSVRFAVPGAVPLPVTTVKVDVTEPLGRIRTTAPRSHARFKVGTLVGGQHKRCRWLAPSYDLQLVSTRH
jgi:hypothetical protein